MLNGEKINLDELNYLAKRLDSFAECELKQFFCGMKHENYDKISDLINLTYNIDKYTLLSDVSSPAAIGRAYALSTRGFIPANESEAELYESIGKKLIEENRFQLTEYGILIVDDIPPQILYDGRNFPVFDYYASDFFVTLEYGDHTEGVALAEDPDSLYTATERLGADCPEDCEISFDNYNLDWEPLIPIFTRILEVEGVVKLSQLVAGLSTEKIDGAKLRAVADYAEVHSSRNLSILSDRLNEFIFLPDAHDDEDVGRYYVNDYEEGKVYSLGIDMEDYFDFYAFGEFMIEEYNGKFTEEGYVAVSGYGCGEFLDELYDESEYDMDEGVTME